jgi:uncharacterized membrane protein (DUF2068 family)
VEAHGLWRGRTWAQWFAIVAGGIYLPVEIYEIARHATVIKAVVLLINLGIVGCVAYVRLVEPSE